MGAPKENILLPLAYRPIEGYKTKYRISDLGEVERLTKKGDWVRVSAYMSTRERLMVRLTKHDGKQKREPVTRLMAEAFMGGHDPTKCIVHRNGMKSDCCLTNLVRVPKAESSRIGGRNLRRPVLKLDQTGEVVEVYSSVQEAAKKNYMSRMSITRKCLCQVKDPFATDGYNYQYDSKWR